MSSRPGPTGSPTAALHAGNPAVPVATILLGGVTAGLVVAQAWLIATVISRVVEGHQALAAGPLLRWPCCWSRSSVGPRSGGSARGWPTGRRPPRSQICAPPWSSGSRGSDPAASTARSPGAWSCCATSGIDALDSYFARYLPQLFLAVIVPVTVVIVISGADITSAVIIAVTVPLIPLFMALVGASTSKRMQDQARLLHRLSGHFLDVVAGLPTLKVFGRAKAQAAAIRDITDRYRTATMATLKVAFLSSLILELLATYSVAVVAVAVGLRLLGGQLSFGSALFVLILAPEAYLPLRQLGTNYHSSAEGHEGRRGGLRDPGSAVARSRHPPRRARPVALCDPDRQPRRLLPRAHAAGPAGRLADRAPR